MASAFVNGLLLGASLIIAIGAQNAFILRQGLLKQHVFILCLICATADAFLVTVGVMGIGSLISQSPGLITVVTIGGAVFLFVYGVMALRRAFTPQSMERSTESATGLWAAIATCLALTFLNPHVYLDTVVLLGGISSRYDDTGRIYFGSGAALSSFIWFFSLGYGARLLTGFFEKPRAWQVLDTGIAIVMWGIAATLVLDLIY